MCFITSSSTPFRPWSSNDKLRELYNKHLPSSHPAKCHNRFARPANSQQRSYTDVAKFTDLQKKVKWLEDQHSFPPVPRSSQPHVPLTATVTELTKTVKQGMAQQQQFLAARDNVNSQ
ncbi:hypothetical protein RhiirC2_791124 [Rhizophagus irregularis]|uniref:Uncharacterized protein n=1 Tax=Rhizophagus irregularis TaxID=588596 RepID=A0A2N1MJW5_9GLOM|nr:hypothetical protein RhiirC2_791124 [Rhizophagus irregularis]